MSIKILTLFCCFFLIIKLNQNLYTAYEKQKKIFFHKSPLWYFSFKSLMAHSNWCYFLSNQKDFDAQTTYNYLNAITDLDPYLCIVYRYGAILLSLLHKQPKLALALLHKNFRIPFHDKRVYWHLGYTYLLLQQQEKAHLCFEQIKH